MGSDSKHPNNSRELEAYHPLLSESIDRFLTQYRNGATDFSNFTTIFTRLLQNSPNPPLEIVWFYSALTFHGDKSTASASPRRFWTPNYLFQLLSSCSSYSSPATKVAVLAPVISELCRSLSDKNYSRNEVESLVEGIISYITICNGQESSEEHGLSYHFVDLIRVWMVDKIGEKGIRRDDLRIFFPIASEKVLETIVLGSGVGYLAGVVMCEAFLLKIVMILALLRSSAVEVEKDVHDYAVKMISGTRNLYFLDVLLSMLLEPVLPVDNLLGPEGGFVLRKAVYDAVITVEYSFFNPGGEIKLSSMHISDIALKWLCVIDNAIRFVRENNNTTKVIAYLTAFAKSGLVSQLLKLVSNQHNIDEARIATLISTPASLIKWLLSVEEQGLKVFESDICRVYAKASVCKPMVEVGIPASPAPCLVTSTPINGVRKREEMNQDEGQKPVKLLKFESCLPLVNDDGMSCGSEVENQVLDDGMVVMEQEIVVDAS